jgi:hypothetical protein
MATTLETQSPNLQRLDALICRILLVTPRETSPATAGQSTANAERAFNASLAFSAVRCILQYAILPFVLPIIGVVGNFAVYITMAINVLAIVAIYFSLRRFWRVNYKGKYRYGVVALIALFFLLSFLILDIVALAA